MADDSLELNFDTQAIEAGLQKLSKKLAKEYITKAMQVGGDVMLETLVVHTPERTDEPTPDGTSLPPGILKADMHSQVIIPANANPKVRIGPTEIAGNVARWQNNGWMLTSHGKSKASRKKIKQIEGKHFIEAAFDESNEKAVNAILQSLSDSLAGDTSE